MRSFIPRPGALLAIGLLAANTASGAAVAPAPLLPCELKHPQHLAALPAQCLELTVAENPQLPAGRQISLHVAVVPAVNRDKRPDPLFVLAGGPGTAASAFYTETAAAFARIHRNRDIVLVDQRGTGMSHPLNCALTEEELYGEDDSVVLAQVRRCRAALEENADLAQYTTSLAVQDLERVRTALGYRQVNLYGVSYGTRVAQHYLRRFPQHTRAVVLDGVVPPAAALGATAAQDAQDALEDAFARCVRDRLCHARFGDPAATYGALRAQLAAHAVPVNLADPTSGEPLHMEFTARHFAAVLRLLVYAPSGTALLPLLLHEALVNHDFTAFAAQSRLISREFAGDFAIGMHNTVVCSEDVPLYPLQGIDRVALARTFMGTHQIDGLVTVCSAWPTGPVDADFHAPLVSDVPVLLLSGSADPVTPPAFAESARRGLHNSLHVVLPGFGHAQLGAPCMARVLERFYERPAVEGLDVACTRDARPQPFFLTRNGPGP
ncbi:MAG TPA: alpha/beta hydrolase [Steroidobacteraceae bacterium]|nr:alpha/beta hydrolase [Steroidobacteraceae bacterium]